MKIEKLNQLYEGKAKKVFETSDPELLIVDYKDDATAFNGLKKGTIESKGIINNKVSNFIHICNSQTCSIVQVRRRSGSTCIHPFSCRRHPCL